MPTYQVQLSQFRITDTRSYHDDTLIAGLGVAVNGKPVGLQVAQMGDFNNGTHEFAKHNLGPVNNVVVNSTDILSVVYEIYNNGHKHHPNKDELSAAINKDLASYYSQSSISATTRSPQDITIWNDGNFKDEVSTAFWTGGLYELFKAIYGGCDGLVAGGAASILGQNLEDSVDTAPGKLLTISTRFNAGDDNYDKPCNPSGSNYIVTWFIQHYG